MKLSNIMERKIHPQVQTELEKHGNNFKIVANMFNKINKRLGTLEDRLEKAGEAGEDSNATLKRTYERDRKLDKVDTGVRDV